MSSPKLGFHGAAHTVTGSCFELQLGASRVLIDCGMFQGTRAVEALNLQPFRFEAKKIDAVLLTHAHIDHSGLLPKLVQAGFTGRIWCTRPTADLLAYMLPDSGRIQEFEAERHNRRPDRRDTPFVPLYGEAAAVATLDQLHHQELNIWFDVAEGVRARFWNAGHILGAASIEVEAGGVHMLFSGDLGPQEKAFHADPDAPAGLDHILCEATYGDRTRIGLTIAERRELFAQEIESALAKGGNLVIPAFAIERTQELLLDLAHIINSGRLSHRHVFIDSPLATRATHVFARYRDRLEDMDGSDMFAHPAFHFVESVEASRRLNDMSGAIIIAASGMAEAGRVRHHLLHNLPRHDSTVLFVGFQAQGSLGRVLQEGATRVRISGRDVQVRASIRQIDHYSAHADRDELLAWIAARAPVAGSIFLTHGEETSLAAMAMSLAEQDKNQNILQPEIGEQWELPKGQPAKRLATGRTELRDVMRRDWQNDYADLAAHLKSDLQRIEDEGARREAIARMRSILKEYGGRLPQRNHHGKASGT